MTEYASKIPAIIAYLKQIDPHLSEQEYLESAEGLIEDILPYCKSPQDFAASMVDYAYTPEEGQQLAKIIYGVQESMKQLHKKLIYNITESNYAEANKLLEQLAEEKLRARINESLKRVDEGLFDRLGARASGLGAGIKANVQNAATRVGSAAKAVGQNIAGAVTGKGFSAGQAIVDAANKQIAANDPAKRAKAAKADNLIASFAKDLSILYPTLNTNKVLSNLRTQLNLAPRSVTPTKQPVAAATKVGAVTP